MHKKHSECIKPYPGDLKLAVHVTAGDTFEWSQVLLARARLDGTMELLTAAWEKTLGYARSEFAGKTLGALMRAAKPAVVVAAILDERTCHPVDVTFRCKDGRAKRFRLHRRVDDYLRQVFIVAEHQASSVVHEAMAAENDDMAPPADGPRLRLTR
jgi:hypothetical protein